MIRNDTISLNSVIKQAEGNIVSNMDGEKVMLSVAKGKYFNLGIIGGHIWDLIEEPTTILNLIEQLVGEYNVSESVCEDQVMEFVNQLREQDIIEIHQKVKNETAT